MRKIFAFMLTIMMVLPAMLQAAETAQPEYIEGKQYQVLPYPVRTRDANKIEVVELFWYGCPHCYHFEPMLQAWLKTIPEDVDFWRSPAVFGDIWQVHAQTFYAAQAMGVLDKIHQPLFDALARDHKPYTTPDAVADFLATLGVDKQAFLNSYNSFSVRGEVQQAIARGRSYRATGVPTVVVNGKYRVDAGMAGGMENLLKVVDFLIAKERAEKHS